MQEVNTLRINVEAVKICNNLLYSLLIRFLKIFKMPNLSIFIDTRILGPNYVFECKFFVTCSVGIARNFGVNILLWHTEYYVRHCLSRVYLTYTEFDVSCQ